MVLFRTYAFFYVFILAVFWTPADICAQRTEPSDLSKFQYVPGLIVVKVGPSQAPLTNGRAGFDKEGVLGKIAKRLPGMKMRPAFPQRSLSNARRAGHDEFSNIYKVQLPSGMDVIRAIERIRRMEGVIYAEPYYANDLLYIPDDSQIGSQNHLPVIHAYEAWDLEKGDSTIVIGIVDTGVDIDHPDLQNIAYNTADPVNGVDDDNDGYIDNYYGWDLSDEDNDPNADGIGHGSFVTGIASARTDNTKGVAGVGFRSKFLPVKVLQTSTNKLVNNYEGIVYAADHGCKVINLAWGGVYPWFKYGQDLINYAVMIKDAVVLAAAGNTNKELDFFPASFDNVLSVGGTDFDDNKAAWATYSYHIDVMAPGDGIFTTNNAASYRRGYGSSFALPQVAGTAALIRARYPDLTAQQVMERIRISCDDIYSVGSNMDYYGMLGKGRLNVYRALTDTLSPSVRQIERTERRSFMGYLFYGDTVEISGRYQNFLYPVGGLKINMSTDNDRVYIDQDAFFAGDLRTFGIADNSADPFVLRLGEDFIPGERIVVRLDYHGDQYDDFQYFILETTPEYFPVYAGKAELTIASDGDLGYNADGLTEGEGVYFDGNYLGDWMGLILATDSMHVSDNIVNDYIAQTKDKDFEKITYARLYKNSTADVDARSLFRESVGKTNPVGIQAEQKILGWENDNGHGYFTIEYRIVNLTDSVIDHLSAGIFADWDLSETGMEDAAGWYGPEGIAYTYNKPEKDLYAGFSMLTPGDTSYYAIDVGGDPGYPSEIDSVFTDTAKYRFLTVEEQKRVAGQEGKGNNVAQMFGTKNLRLLPGEGRKIAFVMLFGHSLEGLDSALQEAKANYGEYISHPPVEQYFYACYGDSALVDPAGGEVFEYYEDPAMQTRLDSGTSFTTPPVLEDRYYYIVNIDSGYRSDVRAVRVVVASPEAGFVASRDTVLIGEGTDNEVQFANTSSNAEMWRWDFGNGSESTLENPSAIYDQTGTYEVKLIVSNSYHCADSIINNLLVAGNGPVPEVENRTICKGDTIHLQASNTAMIRVYSDPELQDQIFEGEKFITGPINRDSVFYVLNAESPYLSLPAVVHVGVKAPETGFDYMLDTLDLTGKYILEVTSRNKNYQSVNWYLNGNPAGTSDPVLMNYGGMENFEIRQVLEDSAGCKDALSVSVTPSETPSPGNDTLKLCRGMSAVITPAEGEVFYFYGDAALTDLLYKGKVYSAGPVYETGKIYVTCMDSLLESQPAEVSLWVSGVTADFSFSTDTLNLREGNTVVLTDESTEASWSYWELPSGGIDSAGVLNEQFEESGIYTYRLFAGDEGICVDSISKDLHVIFITGLAQESREVPVLYPNPAKSLIHIRLPKNPHSPFTIQLTDAGGRLILEQGFSAGERSVFELNASGLSKGLYFIKISAGDLVYFGKFLKK